MQNRPTLRPDHPLLRTVILTRNDLHSIERAVGTNKHLRQRFTEINFKRDLTAMNWSNFWYALGGISCISKTSPIHHIKFASQSIIRKNPSISYDDFLDLLIEKNHITQDMKAILQKHLERQPIYTDVNDMIRAYAASSSPIETTHSNFDDSNDLAFSPDFSSNSDEAADSNELPVAMKHNDFSVWPPLHFEDTNPEVRQECGLTVEELSAYLTSDPSANNQTNKQPNPNRLETPITSTGLHTFGNFSSRNAGQSTFNEEFDSIAKPRTP